MVHLVHLVLVVHQAQAEAQVLQENLVQVVHQVLLDQVVQVVLQV